MGKPREGNGAGLKSEPSSPSCHGRVKGRHGAPAKGEGVFPPAVLVEKVLGLCFGTKTNELCKLLLHMAGKPRVLSPAEPVSQVNMAAWSSLQDKAG